MVVILARLVPVLGVGILITSVGAVLKPLTGPIFKLVSAVLLPTKPFKLTPALLKRVKLWAPSMVE